MLNIEDKMSEGIDMVKARFNNFNLSDDQAKKIFLFEEEWNDLPSGNYLSPWEQDDYELDVFGKILDNKQMQEYLKVKAIEVEIRIAHNKKIDQEQQQYIAVHEKLNEWLANHVKSTTFRKEFVSYRVLLRHSKSKIDFLRAEYQIALYFRKTAIIKRHYREYKRYAPSILQVELLKHTANIINPSYALLSAHCDIDAIAVADTLIKKYSFIPERHGKYFDSAEKEFANYYKKIKKKHVMEKKGGWHFNINTSAENQLKEKVFPILLASI